MRKTLLTSTRLFFYVALFLFVSQSAAIAQNGAQKSPDPEKTAKIQEVLSLAHKYRQFNGSALVVEKGKVIYRGAFGMANMEWGIPNTPETKFRLGSITKQFTSMLTLQLVEQGKIKLDARLSDYLPDYRKDVGEKVTIHHLLTHTSGIPSYTDQAGFFENVSRNPYKVADFVKKYTSGDLLFEPGSKFAYNNSGYFLLGAIIERVTGKPYEQVLKENILDPVGMKNTGYDHYETIIQKRAAGYSKTIDGYTNANYLDMSIPYAAGSLYSTVDDLYLWDQALYTDKLISAQSKELMYKPFLQNYAYGWVVRNASFKENDKPVPTISHGGGINGFATNITRFPDEKSLIVILDNTGQNTQRLSDLVAKILYGQPYDPPRMSIAEVMDKTIREKGFDAGIAQYRELKTKQSPTYNFAENELNTLGYQLMRAGKTKEAVEIFKLNVEAYPKASNTYDSLAEGYLNLGERELAITNYRKALELDATNANAIEALKKLEQGPVTVDGKVFDAYVGEYELGPGFVLRVFREGEKFMTQATGQEKVEIVAESETTFSPRSIKATLTFVKDSAGNVSSVRLNQGGREVNGKKIK
ncbi:MAG TPA: serine hydrolase [Pyrinomonadaceae bacterium]|nr:serine hydrolase [Pyrinomonadaceae bacterium]